LKGFVGDGKGGFVSAGPPYPTPRDSWRFGLGDINGDGRADLVLPDPSAGKVMLLLHR
jgi:hypothetical protein